MILSLECCGLFVKKNLLNLHQQSEMCVEIGEGYCSRQTRKESETVFENVYYELLCPVNFLSLSL